MRRAAQRLAGLGFYVSLGDPRESDVRKGRVAETEPGRDEDAPRGSTVYIYPSAGPDGDAAGAAGVPGG